MKLLLLHMVAHRMKTQKQYQRNKEKENLLILKNRGAIYVTLTAIKRKIRLSLREKSHKIEMMIKTQECFLRTFYYFFASAGVFRFVSKEKKKRIEIKRSLVYPRKN